MTAGVSIPPAKERSPVEVLDELPPHLHGLRVPVAHLVFQLSTRFRVINKGIRSLIALELLVVFSRAAVMIAGPEAPRYAGRLLIVVTAVVQCQKCRAGAVKSSGESLVVRRLQARFTR